MYLRMYNTLSKQHEAFVPTNPNEVSFYSCGPTVYDDAHIGNFRSFLAADVLRRWIESPLCTLKNENDSKNKKSRTVVQVMNITDVGHMTEDTNADGGGQDKMEVAAERILEAKKTGKIPENLNIDPHDPVAVARYFEQRFKEDAIALGLKVAIEAQDDPTLMPRASEHIAHMQAVIVDLLDRDAAYAAGEPGSRAVYFNTQAFPEYGRLSGNTLDHLQGGAGGRVNESQQSEKKHPADFLLWKEDKAHTMRWDAPAHKACDGWDQGYPGWHIECSAMALSRLVDKGLDPSAVKGATIDLHSGGEDNIFPHHECEIAQSCCFTGADSFANFWFHARFLKVEGQKMSKSKGTMYTLRDLTNKGIDPAAIRLELIKTHYRANADFSMQGLKDSARMVQRWRKFLDAGESGKVGEVNADIREQVSACMNDDLNIAGAIGAINAWIKQTPSPTKADAEMMRLFDGFLGVCALKAGDAPATDTGIAIYQPGVEPSDEIESLLAKRAQAKKDKDFASADAIRDQLAEMGLSIMDKPGGKVEVGPSV
ncbi:MAG: cysteine--tRNA ligase [Phycisphaerales bacterium]